MYNESTTNSAYFLTRWLVTFESWIPSAPTSARKQPSISAWKATLHTKGNGLGLASIDSLYNTRDSAGRPSGLRRLQQDCF